MEAIQKAITILKTQSALAREIGVSQPTVWDWLHGVTKPKGEHAVRIEKATGGAVTRQEIRPDIFE